MADYDDVMRKLDYLEDTKSQIKEAIVDKGQPIEAQDPFREYVDKIKKITSGGVKLFDSLDEMYADTKSKEGDLAVVYNNDFSDIYYGVTFSAIQIPKVINISNSQTYSRSINANSTGGKYGYFYCYIPQFYPEQETNNNLRIELSNDKRNITLYYTPSTDGLTYTFDYGYDRISSQPQKEFIFDTDSFIYDFETSVTLNGYDSVFDGLFKVRFVEYYGLYQYTLNNRYEQSVYYGNNIRVEDDNLKIDLVDWLDMQYLNNNIYYMTPREQGEDYFHGLMVLTNVSGKELQEFTLYKNRDKYVILDDNLYVLGMYPTTSETEIDDFIANNTYTKLNYDMVNWTCTPTNMNYTKYSITYNEETCYYAIGEMIDKNSNITNWQFNSTSGGRNSMEIFAPQYNNDFYYSSWYGFDCAYVDKYVNAPNQFTALDNSYIVTGKTAYGRNGIITGDGTYLQHTTTSEFYNYFMPQLPTSRPSLADYTIQTGNYVPYYTFVNRKHIKCTDIGDVPTSDSIVVKLETLLEGKYTSTFFSTIYNATYHRNFLCEDDNEKLYYGYFGYNMSDKQSSSSSGGIVHEEFHQIYGMLICLDDMTVYRTVSYTNTWRPFNGWGNNYEDPNADVAFMNYDFLHDEFIMVVTTGSWAWTGSNAPYMAIMRINGTTGQATPTSWKIGRNGVPNEYAQVTDVRYDITTQKLIVPLSSWNSGSWSYVERILKMDLSSNKSIWVSHDGKELNGLYYLGGEESFYTHEPIYFYYYTDSNSTTHYVLKRIDDDRTLEIPEPYNFSSSNKRYIYGGYLYFLNNTRDQATNKYPLYRVNLSTMTLETAGYINSYSSAYFVLYNKIPHIVLNNYLYSLDDLENPLFFYYNSSNMFNDVRIDGIEMLDGNIQGTHPKATVSSGGLDYSKVRQNIYQFTQVTTFPVPNDLCFVWPNIGNGTKSTQPMYQSLLLKVENYSDTLAPEEYKEALKKTHYIEFNEWPVEENGGGV